jgi:hypothetical protein
MREKIKPMKKTQNPSVTTANLIASNDPATRADRMKTFNQIVETEKELKAELEKCRKRSLFGFTLDEQAFYRRKAGKIQKQLAKITSTLQFLSQFAVCADVRAAAIAELL